MLASFAFGGAGKLIGLFSNSFRGVVLCVFMSFTCCVVAARKFTDFYFTDLVVGESIPLVLNPK